MHQVIWKSSPEGTITKIIERCDHHSYNNYDMYEIIEISYEAIITISTTTVTASEISTSYAMES